jgi:hypothetical protein
MSPATACALDAGTSNPGPGGELVVLPGDYMVGTAPLNSLNSADVHGVAGQPRPRIFSTRMFSAWDVGGFSGPTITFRHLEIHTIGSGLAVSGTGTTTVEDVVSTATGASSAGCSVSGSMGSVTTIKNTICRGANRGVGSTCAGCNSTNITLRNVTAIGDTYGIAFEASVGGSTTDFTVNAFNTIARHAGMTGADVRAQAGSTNSDVAITLANSNYATEEQALCMTPPCTATVTDPGTGTGNQTAAPSFVDAAAGDFHQAAGSPTIDAGVNDMLNGTEDIDGQQRQIDIPGIGGPGTVDIGADERGRDTTTTVNCTPGSTPPAAFVTCTGIVTDAGASPTVPTGLLAFITGGTGAFGSPSCTLAPTAMPGQSSCSVSYLPSQAGTHQITATAPLDATHEGSQGAFALTVTAPPSTTPPGNPTSPINPAGNVRKRKCKKKQKGAAAAKRRKCRKKR